MIEHITITEASEDDCADIFEWRNDPLSRAMSTTTTAVTWEEHLAWFRAARDDPSRHLYVGRWGAVKIGLCRFEWGEAGAAAEVGMNLSAPMRGKKLSAPLLAAALRTFRQKTDMPVIARVKRANGASIKCFMRCGFDLTSVQGDYNIYRYAGSIDTQEHERDRTR